MFIVSYEKPSIFVTCIRVVLFVYCVGCRKSLQFDMLFVEVWCVCVAYCRQR